MKKYAIALAAALALLGSAQAGIVGGTVDTDVSASNVSGPYENGNQVNLRAVFDTEDGSRIGVGYHHVKAWGDAANLMSLSLRTATPGDTFVDAALTLSDKGKVTVKERAVVMLNANFLPEGNLILGMGLDYATIREGSSSTGLTTRGVFYVPGVPLAIQGDVTAVRTSFGSHNGTRRGIALTYGKVKDWTLGLRYDTGRVHYELVSQPGTIADYNSKHMGTELRTWVENDWGFTLGYDRVTNAYYKRNEVRAGVFVQF